MLLTNPDGGYSFAKGGRPYSAGVIASEGFAIEHVRLARPAAWKAGFERIDAHLEAAGRPRAALCAIALRSPRPFSFDGFRDFNSGYVELLRSWGLLVDGVNPVARTNVAPEFDPPAEPSLYSFAYTIPAPGKPVSFVVSGAGELPEGSLDPLAVIRRGETSPDALADKARFVVGMMDGRLQSLGATWNDVTVTNVYTVHDTGALLASEILPRAGHAAAHGITWHYTRPPIVSIEFEMDVRGCARESVISV
ncbi:MAG TPA: hypothetical protein VMH81_24810 [Bryobacteraceae bacterium]|nr:hypothetical protein [Bryobacteraceae bacterium]